MNADDEHPASAAHGDPAELAALYLAGALPEAEAQAFEQRLKICQASREEVNYLAPVIIALAKCAPPAEPPHDLRADLLSRVQAAAAETPTTSSSPEPFIQLADEAEWRDLHEGLSMRVLHIDRRLRRFTALIRVDAGARYPAHHHPDAEECLVLEGDLRIGSTKLGQGDFVRYPPDSWHDEQWTEAGCVCLISASLTQLHG